MIDDNTEEAAILDHYAITSLSEELQKKLLESSLQLKQSSTINVNRIKNDVKNYILPDGSEVSSFVGIIIAQKHANIHYAGAFQEGQTNPIDCFAMCDANLDAANRNLSPSNIVQAKYSVNCGDCALFQWGSDKNGRRGKDCSEFILLAIYVPSLDENIYVLEQKKANAKVADNYLSFINNRWHHPMAVTTKFTAGAKGIKWSQSFEVVAPTSFELMTNLANRIDEANSILVERVVGPYTRTLSQSEIPFVNTGRPAREK